MTNFLIVVGCFVLVIVTMIGMATGLVFVIQGIDLMIQPQAEVYLGSSKIYSGSKACLSVESSGATTSVKIGGGFMCMFPERYYVDNNLRIKSEPRLNAS